MTVPFQRRFLWQLIRRLRWRAERRNDWLCRIGRAYEHEIQHEVAYQAGRKFILRLLSRPAWLKGHYYLANQLIQVTIYRVPHAYERMRELSSLVADVAPDFRPLRWKIHSNPEADDLHAVEAYHASHAMPPETASRLEELAALLRADRSDEDLPARLEAIVADGRNARLGALAAALHSAVSSRRFGEAFRCGADLSLTIRRTLIRGCDAEFALQLLTLNIRLQQLARSDWCPSGEASRLQTLDELGAYFRYAAGAGLLSCRQLHSLESELQRMHASPRLSAGEYRASVAYLNRSMQWCVATIVRSVGLWKLDAEEVFLRDELSRRSIALPMSRRLEALTTDADVLAKVTHSILGVGANGAVVGLSAGVAVGPLTIVDDIHDGARPTPRGILVVSPASIEVSSAAGLLTLDTASQLSHMHLLARSLGIPHASLSSALLPSLREHHGSDVVLAVTGRGSVTLRRIGDGEDIRPVHRRVCLDGASLDLTRRRCTAIAELSQADAGVSVGPKVAWLAELGRRFDGLVPPGVAVPFAAFHDHVARAAPGEPTSVAERIRRVLDATEDLSRRGLEWDEDLAERLATIREQIQALPLVDWVEDSLTQALSRTVGATWRRVGMFVRSAVNSEDCAAFNAAGLYSTIAHQVGVDALHRSIRAVWASTFSDRAVGWRTRAVSGLAAVMPSVLVMPSVPMQKSGVLVTADLETGEHDRWCVSAGEGIGAAVADSTSELLTVAADGRVRLLQEATSPVRNTLRRSGGVRQTLTSIRPRVLSDRDIATLHDFVCALRAQLEHLPIRGCPPPWELEFGFEGRRLWILQIRPFACSASHALAEAIVGDLDIPSRQLVPLDAIVADAGATSTICGRPGDSCV